MMQLVTVLCNSAIGKSNNYLESLLVELALYLAKPSNSAVHQSGITTTYRIINYMACNALLPVLLSPQIFRWSYEQLQKAERTGML